MCVCAFGMCAHVHMCVAHLEKNGFGVFACARVCLTWFVCLSLLLSLFHHSLFTCFTLSVPPSVFPVSACCHVLRGSQCATLVALFVLAESVKNKYMYRGR